jgi:drug/metabolite transporter (DMT)-like permease
MVVLLALLAALLFALAGAAEQRAASRVLRRPAAARCVTAACAAAWQRMSRASRLRYRARRGLRMATGLLRNPLWIAGWAADGLGFATQAGAVHFGSLSVVQPLLVTTLLFSLPLAALGGRRRPGWADWTGAAAACAGLALVLSGRRPTTTTGVHEARLVALALLVTSAAAALVLLAHARTGRGLGRAVPLSVAAGMLFALSAAFTKLVTDSLATRGIAGTAAYWPSYALMAAALGGLVLQQLAFSSGSLPVTMTAMTITDPLVSYGLGVGGFGEHAPHGLEPVALALAGVGLLVAGVGVLARSPLLHRPAAQEALPAPASLPAAQPAVPVSATAPGATAAAGSAVVPVPAALPAASLAPPRVTAALPAAPPVPAASGPGRAPHAVVPAHPARRQPGGGARQPRVRWAGGGAAAGRPLNPRQASPAVARRAAPGPPSEP